MTWYMDWEIQFLDALQGIRGPVLDNIMAFLSDLGNAGIFWITIGLLLLIPKKYRKYGLQMLVAMALTFVVGNLILKNIFDRTRPCQVFVDMYQLTVMIPFDSSFPSGHTMNGITGALSLMYMDKRVGVLALILAAAIAFSRIYNFMHWPTDVLAGIVIGIMSAVFVNFVFRKRVWKNISPSK